MTEPAPTAEAAPLSLVSRIIGVITSPRATFENVVAFPRPAGILLIVALVIGICGAAPLFTEKGQTSAMNAQIDAISQTAPPTPQQIEQVERMAPYMPYVALVGSLIGLPIMSLIITAVYWAIFNVVLGGTAAYKQVLAIVTHSSVITALGVVAGLPFMMNEPNVKSFAGPFNLGALAPMLEEGSQLARFLTNVSVFSLWGSFVTAVGLSVLYRRKIGGILVTVLALALGLTYLGSMFSR